MVIFIIVVLIFGFWGINYIIYLVELENQVVRKKVEEINPETGLCGTWGLW